MVDVITDAQVWEVYSSYEVESNQPSAQHPGEMHRYKRNRHTVVIARSMDECLAIFREKYPDDNVWNANHRHGIDTEVLAR